ncbi:MAG: type I pullulanase, partial [Bacillaceae bacterium]
MAVQRENEEVIRYGDLTVTNGIHVHSKEFDSAFGYEGNDLGVSLSTDRTSFKLWAPTANRASVIIYDSWDSNEKIIYPMTREEKGVWVYTHASNLEGKYYTYEVQIEDSINEAVDPYAKAVGVNGDRGYIVDLASTNPEGWEQNSNLPFFPSTDAIIYELHVRDFSIHPESGMHHKGKFLAFTETGTTGPNGIATGIDHIKKLGVTHVQLLPIYDYSTDSVDETRLDEEQYNWGYDPKNYNAVEGSYSTNPYDPTARIKELKLAIQSLHKQGLQVIMDVVYNHVFDAYRMSFMKLVPGYYFRYLDNDTLANGSACGNDTASERKMMRKFIVDSVVHWAKEYKINGFRFDLMGLHDVETMNEIRRQLDKIDPNIIVIGEGWDLHTPLHKNQKANQHNAPKMPRIAHFNDGIRDALKGHALYPQQKGFVNGENGKETALKAGIAGGIHYSTTIKGFAKEPNQTVSYAEAHDNHTIWDKLMVTNGQEEEAIIKKMHLLCTSIVLTSQGISFLHAGQEFMRTKNGVENSYRSHTSINWLDWNRAAAYQDEIDKVKALIALRKKHPAFRMKTAEDIKNHLRFEKAPKNVVAYTLRHHANGDEAKHILVIHNGNRGTRNVTIPRSKGWQVAFGEDNIKQLSRDTVRVKGISTIV